MWGQVSVVAPILTNLSDWGWLMQLKVSWSISGLTCQRALKPVRNWWNADARKAVKSSSPSAFPAISLGFIIFGVKFLCMWLFFNPTIVTFCLRGWCTLGVFFVDGIHPSRTWMSGSFVSVLWNACVQRLDLILYSHPNEFFYGMESEPILIPKEIPSTEGSEEDWTHDAATRRTVGPTHYRLSYSGPQAVKQIAPVSVLFYVVRLYALAVVTVCRMEEMLLELANICQSQSLHFDVSNQTFHQKDLANTVVLTDSLSFLSSVTMRGAGPSSHQAGAVPTDWQDIRYHPVDFWCGPVWWMSTQSSLNWRKTENLAWLGMQNAKFSFFLRLGRIASSSF